MPTDFSQNSSTPRYVILDVLRGIALLGICLANYNEFSLYSFLPGEVTADMPTTGVDSVIRFFQYFLIDGKFYTLFSLLFGIGFSIVITRYMEKSSKGVRMFYRRMLILLFIGLVHLVFIWAGDILVLYAAVGMLLPLFRKVSDKKLLVFAAVFWLLPIGIDALISATGYNPAAPAEQGTAYFHSMVGITDANFPVWLVEKQSYSDVVCFNLGGSFIRMQEFIDGNRAFKVLGLFLFGLYIGRKKLYTRIGENKLLLKRICTFSFLAGIPLSLLYAWNAVSDHPLGMVGTAVIYAVSIIPMSFGYITLICMWYLRNTEAKPFRIMAATGRMALTNYIMQSVIGMFLFYGFAFGLGASLGLVYIQLIAVGVFMVQTMYSFVWMKYMHYGPLEWIWRMFTYGRRLKLKK